MVTVTYAMGALAQRCPFHPDLERALFGGGINLTFAVQRADADAIIVAGKACSKVVPQVIEWVCLNTYAMIMASI